MPTECVTLVIFDLRTDDASSKALNLSTWTAACREGHAQVQPVVICELNSTPEYSSENTEFLIQAAGLIVKRHAAEAVLKNRPTHFLFHCKEGRNRSVAVALGVIGSIAPEVQTTWSALRAAVEHRRPTKMEYIEHAIRRVSPGALGPAGPPSQPTPVADGSCPVEIAVLGSVAAVVDMSRGAVHALFLLPSKMSRSLAGQSGSMHVNGDVHRVVVGSLGGDAERARAFVGERLVETKNGHDPSTFFRLQIFSNDA